MIKHFLLILSLALLILQCANEKAITGGPVDKEAPEVMYADPANESVNVDRGTQIYLKFNEQMKPATFTKALQIWPRPPGGYEISSSWTWLKVKFNEVLDSNETYLLTLDKSAQDQRGNGLSNTYVLAFSTGSKLNSGKIVGTIHGSAEIRKNGELFLFRKYDTDLAELRGEPADYIFQPDDDGHFTLPYLAERSYMLFHHWDRNKNKMIDGDDYFGRPVSASVSARSDTNLTTQDIWPRLINPEKIKLLQAATLGPGLIQIRVNRHVTASSISELNLFANDQLIPTLGIASSADDDYAMILNPAIPLEAGQDIWVSGFKDTSNYILSSDTIKFVVPEKLDTLLWNPTEVAWVQQKETLLPGDSQAVSIRSNLPFLMTSDSAFKLVNARVDTLQYPGSLQRVSSMEWLFHPDTLLELGVKYAWQFETRFAQVPLDSSQPDSLFSGSLSTIHPDSLGSLKVLQMGRDVLHCGLVGSGVNIQFQLKPNQAVTLENLSAQNYVLSAYLDKNGNGRYDSGGLAPAAGAEPFWFYGDEIRIRARWETDLGIWRFRVK